MRTYVCDNCGERAKLSRADIAAKHSCMFCGRKWFTPLRPSINDEVLSDTVVSKRTQLISTNYSARMCKQGRTRVRNRPVTRGSRNAPKRPQR